MQSLIKEVTEIRKQLNEIDTSKKSEKNISKEQCLIRNLQNDVNELKTKLTYYTTLDEVKKLFSELQFDVENPTPRDYYESINNKFIEFESKLQKLESAKIEQKDIEINRRKNTVKVIPKLNI